MRADRLVNLLLEDRFVTEAAETYLQVFDKDSPEKGYFFYGSDPVKDYVLTERPNADTRRLSEYIDFFIRSGAIFVSTADKGVNISIKAERFPNFGKNQVDVLEKSVHLSPRSSVEWSGQHYAASNVIYNQPALANRNSTPDAPVIVIEFDKLNPKGNVHHVRKVDTAAIRRGIAHGTAYAVKYPDQKEQVRVVTPKDFKFAAGSKASLLSVIGSFPGGTVVWHNGDLTRGKEVSPDRVLA